MSSWQRTHARANDRRAVKKLVAAEKKAARAKGKVEPKPARPVLPGKNTGSVVSHMQSLKAKAERSKERRNGKHQIIAAAPAADHPLVLSPMSASLPVIPALIDQIAGRLAEKSAGATFGPIPLPAIPGKVTNRV